METKLSKAEQKQANAEQEISNLKSDNKRLMERIDELEKDWNDVDDNESVEDENEEDEEDQKTIIKSKKGRTKHKEESKSRTYKLDPSLKKFSGRGDVGKFIFVADIALENAKVPKNEQLKLLAPHFEGNALGYLVTFINEGKNSWEDFKKILRKQFTPFNYKTKIKNEIESIKHYGNFTSFMNRFLFLINQVESFKKIDEEDKIRFFLNALKPDTRVDTSTRRPKTLLDAIDFAQQYEQMNKPNNQINNVNYDNSKNANKNNRFKNRFNNNGNFNKIILWKF